MTNNVIKADDANLWNKVMSRVLSMPGVKVDRDAFLKKELAIYCTKEQLEKVITVSPVAVLPKRLIDKVAKSCINSHTAKAVALSAIAGIPGGWGMAGTVPVDLAQYYFHSFVLSQKLAYLYGWPDFYDENGNITDDTCNMLTLFIGVMMGVAVANQAIHKIAEGLAGQVVKRLPRMTLTKTVIYPLVKQVAKWIGVNLTKSTFAKSLGKIIPILGGGISGTLTYITFHPSAKRLQRVLQDKMSLLKVNNQMHEAEAAEL